LALLATVGFLFLFVSLTLGRFLRPNSPTTQKLATYECGEPAVGSGSIQFDLRFYVVALLFLIFEVEVAFFFPTAAIFGQSVHKLDPANQLKAEAVAADHPAANAADRAKKATVLTQASARPIALSAMIDLGLFFAVLLVAFAFVWQRGDLNWVRATHHPATALETAAQAAGLAEGTARR
jgi:NADH-quinone oxidoreductase subunit A